MAAVLAAAFTLPLLAQGAAQTGSIYGRVTDETGGVLPGVTVTLSGIGAPRSTTSGSQGDFRFINLSPGSYTVKSELSGFTTVERSNVAVTLGNNTELVVPMKLASVSATITVTSESPLLDTRRQSEGTTFNQKQLESIPTGRDPWVVIQQAPGVQIDRLNIGGNQSGQQSNYLGKGTDVSQNVYNVDGVTITDMSAIGSSPTYYDFDAFQEMQVTTGGSDPSISTPGVALNMVTKRGTNEVHGSGRYFATPGELQAHNLPQEAADQGYTNSTVDRISTAGTGAGIQDYGVEAGGPLWQDHAWLWGSYGRKEIPLVKLGGANDNTYLDDYSAKLNIQPVESNSATGFYLRGNKLKYGRSAGPRRPAETSVDQTGPTTIWKGDDSQVFGPSFVVNGYYAYIRNGFTLTPEGGTGVSTYQDPALVWHRSYQAYGTDRPVHQAGFTSSYFFNTGTLGHELKAGFGWRNFKVASTTVWPGNETVGYEQVRFPTDPGGFVAQADVTRAAQVNYEYTYYNGFLSDTITASNLTLTVGLRYDYQYGINSPSSVAANPTFPELVPALNFPGFESEFTWKDFQPRVGVTYALGAEKKTLLRASYARYADQLGGSILTWDNPLGASTPPGVRYRWNDMNHNHTVDVGELGQIVSSRGGFDINCPSCVTSANVVDPNLKSAKTDEFVVGFDHALLPELVIGANYTYRHRTDLTWSPYIGVTSGNYNQLWAGDPSLPLNGMGGVDYLGHVLGNVGPVYTGTLPADFTGGQLVTNRPDYTTDYNGFDIQMTKRLSNKWMAHAQFAYTDWKHKVGNTASGCVDPTNQLYPAAGLFPGYPIGPTCQNNAQVYQESLGSGSFGQVFLGSKWGFNVSGLYQLPLNFNVAANLYGRQGYVNPYFVQVDTGNGEGTRYVLLQNAVDNRLSDVYNLDLRFEKVISIASKASLTLSIDIFNALNSNTILQRENDATPSPANASLPASSYCTAINPCSAAAGSIDEIQNPRAVRFGARVSF
jgi:hypothetical protein